MRRRVSLLHLRLRKSLSLLRGCSILVIGIGDVL